MRGHIRGRIAAEQAHRAEYAFRKAMEDSLTVGMRARDSTGRITYVNPAFCEMVGFSEEELWRNSANAILGAGGDGTDLGDQRSCH